MCDGSIQNPLSERTISMTLDIVTLRVSKNGVNEGAVAEYPYRLLQNGLVQGGDIRDDLRPRCNTQLPEDVRQGSRARSVRGGPAANVHASAVHFFFCVLDFGDEKDVEKLRRRKPYQGLQAMGPDERAQTPTDAIRHKNHKFSLK